ncbi:hypothetical protein B7Z00_00105 [Candidatus Saccharibacteria bacterium 32-50-10]|nr:MAG: hypothetical protein B7Z00_00105 [Candidatus Saccharibacteria bacterium 32-50-10]
MKQIKKPGFTIIEVMLFVAISGLMVVGLMIGTGTAIQRQEYRDAVQSYANFLRDQYSGVISVENDRPADQACPLIGGGGGAGVVARGQSRCVIIGRYITIDNDTGERYVVRPVFAAEQSSGWSYALGQVDAEYETLWGVRTRLAGQADDMARLGLLIYRDPSTGLLRVRASPATYGSDQIGVLVSGAAGVASDAASHELCVDPYGLMAGSAQSVFVASRSGSADAISVSNATGGCSA